MARRIGKIPKVGNPKVSSIDKSMAKSLAKQASVLSRDGGKSRKTTKVF